MSATKSEFTVKDLNPRSQAVKSLETTVIRCLGLIEAFDLLEKGQDWSYVPSATYRRVIGNDHYQSWNMIAEVFKRWQDGTLYRQVLDLFENLPPEAQKRKEIQIGIRSINARLDGRSEGSTVRPARRAGGTKR